VIDNLKAEVEGFLLDWLLTDEQREAERSWETGTGYESENLAWDHAAQIIQAQAAEIEAREAAIDVLTHCNEVLSDEILRLRGEVRKAHILTDGEIDESYWWCSCGADFRDGPDKFTAHVEAIVHGGTA